MKEERYFYVPDAQTKGELPEEEATHAIRVLRLQEGDTMYLMDGKGTFYHAEVSMHTNKRCCYNILQALPMQKEWQGTLHIAMAPTKMMERVEWMAEKATEIGIDKLSFLECQFSERRKIRVDRIEKIITSATKQSRKAWHAEVADLTPFKQFIDTHTSGHRFICHCYDEYEKQDLFKTISTLKGTEPEITILIGPEGDFSTSEVEYAISKGWQSASLGTSRLRTETAALSAVMMSQLVMRD